ncbi:MAG: glycerate kinase [Bacteroides sp.]
MKKIVIAVDSFKGSVSSAQVAHSVEAGIKSVFPDCHVEKASIADGGEGSAETLIDTLKGEYREVYVNDPLMRPIKARYGMIDDGKTAVIEMAAASGITLLTAEQRNPMKTTTYGTGEMIRHALKSGCRHFLICIGGSATNDGGTGMLQALGFRFLDKKGSELGQGAEILSQIESIDTSNVTPELSQAQFKIACDVTNPFSGTSGAAFVYAPQKGADADMVKTLDAGLKHFADTIRIFNGKDIDSLPGAGAAGGLGGGFIAFLNARLISGIEMILKAIDFDHLIMDADLIITGEGKLDAQTIMGKAPRGVLNAASKFGIPVVAIGGTVENAPELIAHGFASVFSILQTPTTLQAAMGTDVAMENIRVSTIQIMNVIKHCKQC